MFKNHKKPRVSIKSLNKYLYYIKRYFLKLFYSFVPKSLLGRIIVFLTTAMFLILLIVIVFIYDLYWKKIRDKLISGIANDIYYISVLITNKYTPSNLSSLIYKNFYKFRIINNPNNSIIKIYKNSDAGYLSNNAKILQTILKNNLPYSFKIKENNKDQISILVFLAKDKWSEFYVSENVFFVYYLKLIAFYTVLLYLCLIIISYVFFKVLLSPLKVLSKKVKLFGQGNKVGYISEIGALEIRNTIQAFNDMTNRINRHVEQRTLMLSAISHDLKSVLTKMSLTLELESKSKTHYYLLNEINNMNNMITSYLTFARNEYTEEPKQKVFIKRFFNNLITKIPTNHLKQIKLVHKTSHKTIKVIALDLTRVMNNLIDNSLKFSSKVKITLTNGKSRHLKITLEDNGLGIDKKDYDNVFKPFYKIDQTRSLVKGSVGLGLSIVKDIVNKHGGTISLGRSRLYKGLKVTISLPC